MKSLDNPDHVRGVLMPRLTRTITFLSVAIIAMAVVLGIAIVSMMGQKATIIAVDEQGRAVQLEPLEKPMANDARVVSFVSECMRRSFSMDFISYRSSMTDASKCFTSKGNESYQKAMQPLIEQMVKGRYVMSVDLVSPPVVVRAGMDSGAYGWVVQTKMRLYREGTTTRMEPAIYDVEILVRRVDVNESYGGISIALISAKPGQYTK